MKVRIFAGLALCVLAIGLTVSASADVRKRKTPPANQLVQLLPASDAVVTVDVKRFFSNALPKVLSANQPLLEKVTAKLALMKERSGIDIRQFESIAAGVTLRQVSDKEFDHDVVVVARGALSSSALIGAAKLASNGKYKEEKAGDKTVLIISAKDVAAQVKQNVPAAQNSDFTDKIISKLSNDIAVTAIDANTIAFGDIAMVRQAISAARTPVSNDLLSLLGKQETAIASFAAKMPNGMSVFVPLENDELGKNIDSIRYLYGHMDVANEAATVSVTARTLQPAQSKALLETLEGLQLIGKAFLGPAKGADKQVYARMIDNAKFSSKGNEVMLDLQVPQSDIDILVGMLK